MKEKPTRKQINDTIQLYESVLGRNQQVDEYFKDSKKRQRKKATTTKTKTTKKKVVNELPKKTEGQEQVTVYNFFRDYILPRYPNTMLIVNPFSELNSGHIDYNNHYTTAKGVTLAQRIKNQAKAHGYSPSQPDLLFVSTKIHSKAPICRVDGSIYYKRLECNQLFSGLGIELKRTGNRVYKDDGKMYAERKDDHENQLRELKKLRVNGYWADFVIGELNAIEIIKWYFSCN